LCAGGIMVYSCPSRSVHVGNPDAEAEA